MTTEERRVTAEDKNSTMLYISAINALGLDASIGYLHEIAPSKHPLVYDLQELFRYVVDYSVIEILESKLKKSDFITTENYHIRLKPNTAKLLIEKIKVNFNRRYDFNNKQHTLENIMFENARIFGKYLSGKLNVLQFNIPDLKITRVDRKEIRSKIMEIDPEKRSINIKVMIYSATSGRSS